MPCKAATYANTDDIEGAYNTTAAWSLTTPGSKKMCTPTEPGHYAMAGSENQTKCSPGAAA